MKLEYVAKFLHVLLAVLWPPAVIASVAMIEIDASVRVPVVLLCLGIILCNLSGLTSLALRIDKELRADPGKPLQNPKLLCGAHMLGSWLAGTLAFMVGMQQKFDVWMTLIVVVVASFMGAKFIELMADRYLAGIKPPGAAPPGSPP
jgi:hypothetical protein